MAKKPNTTKKKKNNRKWNNKKPIINKLNFSQHIIKLPKTPPQAAVFLNYFFYKFPS